MEALQTQRRTVPEIGEVEGSKHDNETETKTEAASKTIGDTVSESRTPTCVDPEPKKNKKLKILAGECLVKTQKHLELIKQLLEM